MTEFLGQRICGDGLSEGLVLLLIDGERDTEGESEVDTLSVIDGEVDLEDFPSVKWTV